MNTRVDCPYCGESGVIFVDPGGGSRQEYVEDCEVCCRPRHLTVRIGHDGSLAVEATTLDET